MFTIRRLVQPRSKKSSCLPTSLSLDNSRRRSRSPERRQPFEEYPSGPPLRSQFPPVRDRERDFPPPVRREEVYRAPAVGGAHSGRDERGIVPPRVTYEDADHEAMISDRIARERMCRTLFVRNIKVSNFPYAYCARAILTHVIVSSQRR